MNKPTLTLPHRLAKWKIETSHLVAVPEYVESYNLEDLRKKLQEMADQKQVRSDRPPIGKLTFRYETDDSNQVTVVHAYFVNRHDKNQRFMRLRWESTRNAAR